MKKTVLLLGILLGAILMLTACNGNGDDGALVVEPGDTIAVEYTGRLSDGEVFDTSEGREPLVFQAGAGMMIPGFDDAVMGMEIGEEKTVEIPADQAYGDQGVPGPDGEYIIPPNSDITFDIEIVSIDRPDSE
ncbi:MAG: FKBP-type peptidyl-prolyl cis-trans isomerase [Coriobacteriia bacterium]|nr:FKBP-type peptidyl-prolyl cis-trans isomerase [Coriobacteriia bacterium]